MIEICITIKSSYRLEMMPMWKGIYGIFSDFSYSNFTFRPKLQKQGLKEKRLATLSKRFLK